MANDIIPNQIIMLSSIVIGLICIYLGNIPIIGSLVAILSISLSVIYGTDTLRHIAKHSLGTGVPSIVYMLSAVGLVGYFIGLSVSQYYNQELFFPIISVVSVAVLSYLFSLICKYIFDINVDILSKSFVSIATSSTLTLIGMSVLIINSFNYETIFNLIVNNGLIILLMIITIMIIQNPYNSCMGSNEDQFRTLSLALSNTFLLLCVISLISILFNEYWFILLGISFICWIFFFIKYINYSKHQVASIKFSGLWSKNDGD